MLTKVIIFKNGISENVTIQSLGLTIIPGEVSDIEYDEILILENSQELVDFINAGVVIVNDGTRDLNNVEALDYLQIGSDFIANYYNKQETDQIINNIVVNNVTNIEQRLVDDYYTQAEVDQRIAEVNTSGIKGAVDYVEDLPLSGNNEGDVWIVRGSLSSGAGPTQFVPDGQTGLYIPADSTWRDQLGHYGRSYSSMNPVDGGKFGKCLDFDGNNDYLKFYSSNDFGEGPTLTVGAWVYPKRSGTYGLINRWEDNDNGWKIDVYGGKLRVSLDTLSHSSVQFTSPNTLPRDKWSHIAFVYNGNEVVMYINATPVNSANIVGETIDSYNLNLYIGKYVSYSCDDDDDDDDDDHDDKFFDGLMDDIFIENRAMSQEELEGLVVGEVSGYNDEGFYMWSGTEWEFLARNTGESGSVVSHNSLLGLNSGDYQHLTSNQKVQLTEGDNTILHKHDDLYYTKSESNSTFAVKSHNHDERYYSKAQVDGLINGLTFADISANDSSTNVTGAELENLTNGGNADGLHTHENIGGSGTGGLDEAYDGHSDWSKGTGRQVTVDFGPVTLDAKDGFAPLHLKEQSSVPNQWLSTGHICVYDSELFLYDATRSSWLSVSGYYIGGGFNSSNIKRSYLRGYNGTSFSNDVGWVAPWDGVIVSLAASSDSNTGNAIEVRRNGNSTSAKVWFSGNKKTWSRSVDVKFNEGDVLNFYATENDHSLNRPQAWAIIKRRIS